MQLYERGIRRRLAPMLGNDRRLLELSHSLLLVLPGTPVIRYGDEIGMGEDLALPERYSVRTPMQWSTAPNAGFSTAPAERLARPVITQGDFGVERVNVADQQRDPDSLLNWLQRAIGIRRGCPEIGWGACRVLPAEPCIVAFENEWRGSRVVSFHNLDASECRAQLPDAAEAEVIELFSNRQYPPMRGATDVVVDGYGYRWFRLTPRPHRT
jgi:maltose alpha-D-glucosyltransferase / alpha-amylase